ncbi:MULTISPECIES: hypothetical protein [Dehalobacter]|jgi:hypothetical protein|uniref:Uncharacterized protein n=2 Tax=Dehalobacter restrictus TaxID=55583 RepID=A0A857DFW9_9FIRM|nr:MULTISPECIES: hypothetical protein [Dehalobacter]AHF09012.1 hypothetical protein DEHRE_01905 [Dehalobacter restrictus DSM 9455]MCG1024985.1 hypothetical protein [Dehalobacter sp.]QGZ99537.1 hypothetical protein GQ588_02150 [Dehalobacter restrictus]
MKQITQKKPKTFRTLIRRINMGSKELQNEDKVQGGGKSVKTFPFLFRPVITLSVKTQEVFLFITTEGGIKQFESQRTGG